MKKIIILLILLSINLTTAQLNIIGSENYGRLLNFVYDEETEDVVYATTQLNHIVVSYDNGQNWSILYSFPDNSKEINNLDYITGKKLSFTAVSANSICDKIYVLNVINSSIFRTYTVPQPTFSDENQITSYSILESNPDIVLAQQHYGIGGGLHGKVYYTQNGGVSWHEVYFSDTNGGVIPMKVIIKPTDPSRIFIARAGGWDYEDYGGLLVSDDYGENWIEYFSGTDFGAISINPSNSDEVLIGSGYASQNQNLYKSLDGGDTWNAVSSNWSNESSIGILNIEYNHNNPNNIVVLTVNEIINSIDGFNTYSVYHYDNDTYNPNNYFAGSKAAINPFAINELLIANNDYPLVSKDGGLTVTQLKNPFFKSFGGLGLYKNSNSKNLMYGLQSGFIHKDLNTNVETPHGILPPQSYLYVFPFYYFDKNFQQRNYSFSSNGSNSGFAVSNDYGDSYLAQFPVEYQFLNCIESDPLNQNIIYASFSNDLLTSELKKIEISNPENPIISTVSIPQNNLINSIFIDHNNPNIKIVSSGTKIFKSNNDGVTWINYSDGLDNLIENVDIINQISQNPLNLNQFMLATSQGVFLSNDYCNTWMQISNFSCHSISFSNTISGNLVAITNNLLNSNIKIRYSNNYGETWNEISDSELLYINCYNNLDFDFYSDNVDIYIPTYDLGIIKYTINFNSLSIPEPNKSSLSVYPIPTNNFVNINNPEKLPIKSYQLLDMTGKKIVEQNYDDKQIDISSLPIGLYILKVNLERNTTQTFKIIKQ